MHDAADVSDDLPFFEVIRIKEKGEGCNTYRRSISRCPFTPGTTERPVRPCLQVPQRLQRARPNARKLTRLVPTNESLSETIRPDRLSCKDGFTGGERELRVVGKRPRQLNFRRGGAIFEGAAPRITDGTANQATTNAIGAING
ncbi:hypothetical protein GCM10017781_38510 [Deinococcus metalli]|uniref:Uncharacterized protein n=1 Tax=Deinococcus metalli TaxID=1141878 RepID=A0ABQ3JVR1_9DEIO|nr:hypothetical protein GCM10017781_38510 [Deinococcus metalli]